MSFALLVALVVGLGLALAVLLARTQELGRMRDTVRSREHARETGADKALLRHPVVDLSNCLGCGTCVAACPEQGVLELVHGQAMVVRGARCVGHAHCETECPTGAITVTLGDLSERDDVPALEEGLEAIGQPGLFLAGEVTAHALIKTAIEQGKAVAAEVARKLEHEPLDDTLDLLIVGAGPAGLACALEAKARGLHALVVDQEPELGGTVAKYPRAKLVLTQPVEMPLYGRLRERTYAKEELMEMWLRMAHEQQLAFAGSQTFSDLERQPDGTFVVATDVSRYRARTVCLAIGRRGTPRKLEVPGEDLPKVAYSLVDARSYTGRRVLVVGGGDSAVETALGLAEQPGNEVTLSYRRGAFFRLKAKNEERIERATAEGRVQVLFDTQVEAIEPDHVRIAHASAGRFELPNDDVFVMAGGVPPFDRLKAAGVSFDLSLAPGQPSPTERGTGVMRALAAGFMLSLLVLAFVLYHRDYYFLSTAERPAHAKHDLLRPGLGLGLLFGIASVTLIGANLLYLARRAGRLGMRFGTLGTWMTVHVATGILAFLLALLHAALGPRDTVGGQAFWLMAILIATGAVGRYVYAWVPRAANGRELELSEVRAKLDALASAWDQGQHRFRERARAELDRLVERRQWRGSFLGRALALIGAQHDVRAVTRRLSQEAHAEGLAEDQVAETLDLVRTAHRTALMAAHYEDLRALMNTWRWLHRWGALLLLILVGLHVVYALSYGAHFFEGSGPATPRIEP